MNRASPIELRKAIETNQAKGLINSPGHNHFIPGMWDNADSLSRIECHTCAAFSKTKMMAGAEEVKP